MKILRVRLRNYRGTDEREVRFAPTGVTLVAGPNEIGKSSLAQAIDLIFEYFDSSGDKKIKAVKPVHRDASSEIEIDVRTGPYEFTYFKRFHKKPETVLHVTRPRSENLTGREAHDRAWAIIEETVDLNLWKALRIEQGEGIGQAALADQTALSRALDRAAGGSSSGPREESLYEAVWNESRLYFTETGKENKDLAKAAAAAETARADAAALSADLKKLEADIARSERLAREIRDLEQEQALRAGRSEALEKERQAVDRLKSDLASLKERCDAARAKLQAAAAAVAERDGILAELTEAESSLRKITEDMDAAAPALNDAVRNLEAAAKAIEEARQHHAAAQRTLRTRQEDYEFRHEALDLEQLEERKLRIDEAIREALAAEETLAAIRVDDPLYEEIHAAALELHRAQARVEKEGPSVRIEAQVAIAPEVDGAPVPLSRGQSVERPVGDSLTIRLPGVADITVKSGTSAEASRKALAKAERTLADLCARAGVAGLKEAGAALETRKEALRAIGRRDEVLRRDLRDLTPETFEAKIARLRERVSAYPGGRSSDPSLPPDFDTAKAWVTEANSAASETEAAQDRANREWESARARREKLDRRHTESSVHLEREKERLERARQKLASARARETDDALREVRDEAERALSRLEGEAGEATKQLEAQNPDRVEALADNAREALDKVKQQLRDLLNERIELAGNLRARGEEGLAERLGETEARSARLEREREGLRARAAAVKLLYDTLTEERETARRNYVAPLRGRIEKLGRIVFGETFGVEMGDDLSILSRTLEGRTIPWSELSGGAREQIGLIARLACAMIVSQDGGVPLIIDDALGNTDPERLEGMAAVLSVAARECQIIVLTCYPERYRHVATAETVNVR